MTAELVDTTRAFLPRFDASPTPYHAVATVAALLDDGGFSAASPVDAAYHGQGYVAEGGALVAWSVPGQATGAAPVRVVGAHTDSPNLRIKPQPDTGTGQWQQLGVEVYGGVLLNSWLDRDLGLAGRVVVRDGDDATVRLFVDNRPLLRVPQLAIHLDRDIRDKGLKLNKQNHMAPVWGFDKSAPEFHEYLADQVGVGASDVLSWDVMVHDLTPSTLGGFANEFFFAPRIDNQLSCWAASDALLAAAADPGAGQAVSVVALFDHEEVGSESTTGADSPLLERVLDRIAAGLDASPADRHESRAGSLVVSADCAHATHPNYSERHESDHQIDLNAGPVLKVNTNQRYATDALTGAQFRLACERAGVPLQVFVNRTDLRCGSTIGPATASRLGLPVVDVGCPQLSMHSAREMAGSHDPAYMVAALTEVFRG